VTGSLEDTKRLSDKLGSALAVVALAAAVLIASLLTLSSVSKRTRELGTLKAIGWHKRLVVRQIASESLVQGVLGGLLGAALGLGTAALVSALGRTLEATVEQVEPGWMGSISKGRWPPARAPSRSARRSTSRYSASRSHWRCSAA
jgi:putative ABC transport system permease protein